MSTAKEKIARFRKMHESGCFVLPNPWDAGSAVVLARLGFQALGTTSAGLAFGRAWPDKVGAVSLEATLENVRDIVQATPLPVTADFQEGFAATADEVGPSVRACVETGVAGLSIEDGTGDPERPLFARTQAIERLRAARAAIDASGSQVVLTGRCEAWLVGDPTPLETTLDRLAAYAEAGADCLYAPAVQDPEHIKRIVDAVSPRPVNVLMSRPQSGLTVERLAGLGVRRISVGSALARVAWGAFIRAAESIRDEGSFEALATASSFADLNAIFESASTTVRRN